MSLIDALLLDPHPLNVWVAVRTDGLKGSGRTAGDPYNGSTAELFDARMNEIAASFPAVRVHLGPGLFETKGYSDGVAGGWQPAGRMKIIGSGMGVTTLKLIGASDTISNRQYYAIGHVLTAGSPASPNPLDSLEISDLSVDSNLAGQTGSTFACGGIRIMGTHVRLRRIEVKNWGTKSTATPCYALAAITADTTAGAVSMTDCGIEECRVVQPASSPASAPMIALHCGPASEIGATAEEYGTCPFIRNCFVDCGWSTGGPDYRGLSMSWCRGGVVESNQVHNTKYGGPYSDKVTIRDLVVRHNFYKNVAKGPFWNLGTVFPATPAALASLVRDAQDSSIAVATTSGSHGLQGGDRVRIDASAGSPSQFKGIFLVRDVIPPDKFRYQMASAAGQDASSATFQKVFGIARLLVEGNTIELAEENDGLIAIHVHDNGSGVVAPTLDFVHGEVFVRNNKVRYVDGTFETNYTGRGTEVNGARNLLVQNNILECAPPNPASNQRCQSVQYFNNRTPAGVLVRGWNDDVDRKYDELETEAEDAFVLAYLRRR